MRSRWSTHHLLPRTLLLRSASPALIATMTLTPSVPQSRTNPLTALPLPTSTLGNLRHRAHPKASLRHTSTVIGTGTTSRISAETACACSVTPPVTRPALLPPNPPMRPGAEAAYNSPSTNHPLLRLLLTHTATDGNRILRRTVLSHTHPATSPRVVSLLRRGRPPRTATHCLSPLPSPLAPHTTPFAPQALPSLHHI
jgi:hypothetical protein